MSVSERVVLKKLVELRAGAYALTFQAPRIAREAKPGQFIMLESAFYLKRPYGIMDSVPEDGTISLGIDVVGKGSKAHSKLAIDSVLTALGPLGKPFPNSPDRQKKLLIGGGSGIYPLYFLAKELVKRSEVYVSLGFRNRELAVLLEKFKELPVNFIACSDTGGLDYAGNALQGALTMISDFSQFEIYACGPTPMLKAVSDFSKQVEAPTWLSFEARMACGVGFCSGCQIPILASQPKRCCFEGPVFPATAIDWEAIYG